METTMPYADYTDKDIEIAVKSSTSISQVLKKLNLRPAGGNYATLKKKIAEMNIDISHILGQSWNKDNYKPKGSLKSKKAIKQCLIRERTHKCENCKNSKWMGNLIPLELEHINGFSNDNRIENLLLLCPNCHSFTPTYRRKKSSK